MSEYLNTTEFLQDLARDALQQAENVEDRIRNLNMPTIEDPQFDPDLVKPTMEPPARFSDLFEDADDKDALVTWVNGQIDDWIADYFPAISSCFRTVPEDFLCGVLQGNSNGYSFAEQQFKGLWTRTRDRAFETRLATERNLRAELTQRGFDLPPGVLAHALIQADAQLADTVAQVNADIAAKEAAIKLDLLKLAADLSIRYKTSIMSMLADFYRTWVTLPDRALERAKVKAAAYNSLYQALSTYYNVEMRFEELKLSAEKTDSELDLEAERLRILTATGGDRNASLAQAVRAFGDVASGAATAAGSLIAQIEAI